MRYSVINNLSWHIADSTPFIDLPVSPTFPTAHFTHFPQEIYPGCEMRPPLKVLSCFDSWRRREMTGYARWESRVDGQIDRQRQRRNSRRWIICGLRTPEMADARSSLERVLDDIGDTTTHVALSRVTGTQNQRLASRKSRSDFEWIHVPRLPSPRASRRLACCYRQMLWSRMRLQNSRSHPIRIRCRGW